MKENFMREKFFYLQKNYVTLNIVNSKIKLFMRHRRNNVISYHSYPDNSEVKYMK